MHVLSYKGHPLQVVRPTPFHGVDIVNGVPLAVHGLPDGQRIICGISHHDGAESLYECANLDEMKECVLRSGERSEPQGVVWYSASSADCLEELIVHNRPSTGPSSSVFSRVA